MDRERTLQVVLGEAEPGDGFLRFVLEGEGFDIVGMASTDGELERVLRGAHPDVIVLDAGISAKAAQDAKERANGAALVVIWPGDVVAAIADEHVEPHLVVDDLGPAVRSASLRARPREERIVIPDTIGEVIDRWREAERGMAPAAPPEEARPESPRLDRSARGVLVGALTWILVLTTLATIAAGVPRALDVFAGRSPGRQSPTVTPVPSPSPRTVNTPASRPDVTSGRGCTSPACTVGVDARHAGGNGNPASSGDESQGSGDQSGTSDQGGSGNENGDGSDTQGGGTQDGGNEDEGNQDGGNQDGGNGSSEDGSGDGGSQQQDEQGTVQDPESGDVVVSIA